VCQQRNDGEYQQDVNQKTGHVEENKSTGPQNEQEYCNSEKWPKSHKSSLEARFEMTRNLELF
jgi:hypothetical protein